MSNSDKSTTAAAGPALREWLGPVVDREFLRAKTVAYGPNSADDETREGDFGTWGDWRALVLRVAEAAMAAERARWVRACRGVMAEHGGDPAGQLADMGNTDHLMAQCQAAGASQVLIRGIGPNARLTAPDTAQRTGDEQH